MTNEYELARYRTVEDGLARKNPIRERIVKDGKILFNPEWVEAPFAEVVLLSKPQPISERR